MRSGGDWLCTIGTLYGGVQLQLARPVRPVERTCIAGNRPFNRSSGAPVAVAAQASPSRPGGQFGFVRSGSPIPGHDVSGTGWQTLGRAMQSITTMMPVWQCGHSRNDCPVSASKRSR